jgi:hypothetical protein
VTFNHGVEGSSPSALTMKSRTEVNFGESGKLPVWALCWQNDYRGRHAKLDGRHVDNRMNINRTELNVTEETVYDLTKPHLDGLGSIAVLKEEGDRIRLDVIPPKHVQRTFTALEEICDEATNAISRALLRVSPLIGPLAKRQPCESDFPSCYRQRFWRLQS